MGMTIKLGVYIEGISMNKDEVLAKAKKENFLGDEREKEVHVKRNAFLLSF